MKILVIGAKGGLGQAIAKVYADLNPILLGQEDLDITNELDVMKVLKANSPTLVINCAAYNDVDKAEEDHAFAENVNGYAPGFLAHACSEIGATFVHYSSGQVFDGLSESGYDEQSNPNPVNAYGKSKLIGEQEVFKFCKKCYVIRTTWLFGQTQDGKKSFVDVMLEKVTDKEVLKVVEDEFGNPTYYKDLAQITRALVEQKKPFGIYHLVNSGVASRFEWAREIFKLRKIKAQVTGVRNESLQRLAKRPKYEVLNNTKYIQLRPWQEALKEFLNV